MGSRSTADRRWWKSAATADGSISTWDRQFYGQAIPGVEVMCNADPNGGVTLDRDFFVEFGDGYGAHQVRLEGGDCSTDSFCYPSV